MTYVSKLDSGDPRVFVVHSGRAEPQRRLVVELTKNLRSIDVHVTGYDEWNWLNPGGHSDWQVAHRREWRHKQNKVGYWYFGGSWTPLGDLGPLLGQPEPELAEQLNEPDLMGLLDSSKVVILVEEVGQEALTHGCSIEVLKVAAMNRRLLNVRLCTDLRQAFETQSVFPETLKRNGVIGVRVSPTEGLCSEDMALVTFVLSVWADDIGGSEEIRVSRDVQKWSAMPDSHLINHSPRGLHRANALLALVQSDNADVCFGALIQVAAMRDQRLRFELAHYVARMSREVRGTGLSGEAIRRAMSLMPDVDWSEIDE